MDLLYLSRSIRCRALELMKKLDNDCITIKFNNLAEREKFIELLRKIDKHTNELGHPFQFQQSGFEWCTVGVNMIEFSKECFYFNPPDDVVLDIHYFLSTFPSADQLYILEDVLDYSM